jgi:ribosomal protein S9
MAQFYEGIGRRKEAIGARVRIMAGSGKLMATKPAEAYLHPPGRS